MGIKGVHKHKTRKYKTHKYKTRKHKTRKYKTHKYKTHKHKSHKYTTRKHKSHKHKSHKHKTRKHKTRKHKTRKHKGGIGWPFKKTGQQQAKTATKNLIAECQSSVSNMRKRKLELQYVTREPIDENTCNSENIDDKNKPYCESKKQSKILCAMAEGAGTIGEAYETKGSVESQPSEFFNNPIQSVSQPSVSQPSVSPPSVSPPSVSQPPPQPSDLLADMKTKKDILDNIKNQTYQLNDNNKEITNQIAKAESDYNKAMSKYLKNIRSGK
jgi:hypothetical protein